MTILGLEEGWLHSQSGITRLILKVEGMTQSERKVEDKIMLYTTIYNMCSFMDEDEKQQVYNRCKEAIKGYLTTFTLECLKQKHDEGNYELMLREFVQRWRHFKNYLNIWLAHIFEYPERLLCIAPLRQVGLTCFKNIVYHEMKERLRDAALKLILQGMQGEPIDGAFLKDVLDIFISDFGMDYETEFKKVMLEEAMAYYSQKASCWTSELSKHEYLLKVDQCLRGMEDGVLHCIPSSNSMLKLLKRVSDELLGAHASSIIEDEYSGCRALLTFDKIQDLSVMHRRLSPIDGASHKLADIFKQHVIDQGNILAEYNGKKTDKIIGKAFVRKAIKVHYKCVAYVSTCFQNRLLFQEAFKEAFDAFCNKEHVRRSFSPNVLAAFCDHLLIAKGGRNEKASNEVEAEEILEKTVQLIAYINDKDIFAKLYKMKLARRLLSDRRADIDLEKSILTKLKYQFGASYTSKMERMVTEVTLARQFQTSFEDYAKNNPEIANIGGVDLSVTVLAAGLWPKFETSDLNLPAEMVKCVQVFSEFYQAQTRKRKLKWIYSLGTCNVMATFESKSIELIVTTDQAAVLLLFNASDRISYSEIKTQLNLNDGNLIGVLHSLSCAKYKILNKEPADTNTISPTDYFEFNSKFTDKMSRIEIPEPRAEEKKKVIEAVDKDRRYAIDACLVRIMKKRKVATHQQLVSECEEQLGKMFKLDTKVIKKRMEDLIARDYIERDMENPNLFRYLP